jgi:hypothetical protein
MKRLLLAGSVAALIAGCGPGAALEPLVGEDEEAFRITQTDASRLYDDAPSIRARELEADLRAGRWADAWARLSTTARMALAERAGVQGEPGPAVLPALASAGIDPIVAIFGLEPTRISTIPPGAGEALPPSPFVPGDGAVSVFAHGTDGSVTQLRFVYQDYTWRYETVGAVTGS